jgi:fructoselysine-6-P-deglycase FrlB-like protein
MGMAGELRDAPDPVHRQADRLGASIGDLVTRLRRRPPSVVVTRARGSSAHTATLRIGLGRLGIDPDRPCHLQRVASTR